MELKLKLVSPSPVGGWVGGWTKTKLMLISTQVEVVVKAEVELGRKGDENAHYDLEVILCNICRDV